MHEGVGPVPQRYMTGGAGSALSCKFTDERENGIMSDAIKRTVEGKVAVITLDAPPVNALDSGAYFDLYEAMYDFAVDDSISVVVITGAGERAFMAGADVKEFLKFNRQTGSIYTRKNSGVREYIRQFPKPVICAINGLALGGGCALALACDIRIACREAKFSLSEINMGILGGIPYAASIIASGTARKMVYSGETITSDEALRVGLVDEVVDRADLMPRCMQLAERIAAKSPLALKKAKEVMVTASEKLMPEVMAAESAAISDLWATEDKNEAVSAFLEKRKPEFQGK